MSTAAATRLMLTACTPSSPTSPSVADTIHCLLRGGRGGRVRAVLDMARP
ncbi:hypothetical protein [Saccharothrix syringae]|nr:hypothetical protein [Saccharothrix syringae]